MATGKLATLYYDPKNLGIKPVTENKHQLKSI